MSRFVQEAEGIIVHKKRHAAFDENQKRDDHGRWTDGGAEGERAKQTELAAQQANPLAHPDVVFGIPGYRPGLTQDDYVRYVAAYGQEYKAAPLPNDVKLGVPNECYKNASLLVIENEDMTYAEGFAYPSPKKDIPVLHAWAVKKDGTIVDNTFRHQLGLDPMKVRYFGIQYDRSKYLTYLYKARLYGVLGSTDKNAEKAIRNGGRHLR